ncbi:DNA cytosine methyltransferase [Granulosicoccaceae sp. 1_MG-2023]|nr:DNA cytosine methyltransferase [Granulosicoccaceae sp. 1_MG-2023]
MSNLNVSIEELKCKVTEILEKHCLEMPEGTTTGAFVDQALHSVAVGGSLFLPEEVEANGEISKLETAEQYERRRQSYQRQLERALRKTMSVDTTEEMRAGLYAVLYGEVSPVFRPDPQPKFHFIDLFSGIGGMRLGFQQAGGACVFSSEFDPAAQKTYRQNFGEYPFGDITKVPAEAIPDHDVLLAGFPCQPFSHAGLKKGIADTRGTLFHNIAEILSEKRPAFAVLENVKGLLSHDGGFTLHTILKRLNSIGYRCNVPCDVIENGTAEEVRNAAKKMLLKSIDFGVPQNRQRLFIVLWDKNKRGDDMTFEYPEPLPGVRASLRVGDILEADPDESLRISERLWAGHQRRKKMNKRNGKGFGYGLVTPESNYTNTLSARYYKDGSEILVQDSSKRPRKLSKREAARLQGFPDDFMPAESNPQAYKQFGNSVSVPVVKAVAEKVAEKIGKTSSESRRRVPENSPEPEHFTNFVQKEFGFGHF